MGGNAHSPQFSLYYTIYNNDIGYFLWVNNLRNILCVGSANKKAPVERRERRKRDNPQGLKCKFECIKDREA